MLVLPGLNRAHRYEARVGFNAGAEPISPVAPSLHSAAGRPSSRGGGPSLMRLTVNNGTSVR